MEKLKNGFEAENPGLIDSIISQFTLDINSLHGIKHWRRVAEIGNYLAKHTRADIEVVNLFAYLHDSKREDEHEDLWHGKRASIFIEELYNKKLLDVSKSQLDKLLFACEHHSNSNVKSEDVTIQTCWDADRLDLYRVGIIPKKEFLNTDFAKQDEVIELWGQVV